MLKDKIHVVALLARPCGLELFRILTQNPYLVVGAVITHGMFPKAEGGGEREEFHYYNKIAELNDIDFWAIDHPNLDCVGDFLPKEFDVLLSCSWRGMVPDAVLDRAEYGCINLHRGDLPDYPGAEPVKRMVEDGCKEAVITAHEMTSVVDEGRILGKAKLTMPATRDVEDIKELLIPLYYPLFGVALTNLVSRP